MSVAVTSLPVPLSPVTRTVLSLVPMTRRNSNTARMRALRPTTMQSAPDTVAVVMTSSALPEAFELGHLLAERQLHAEIQGHLCARTAGAHPGQPNVRGVPGDADEFDVAAVRLHERPHPREDRF